MHKPAAHNTLERAQDVKFHCTITLTKLINVRYYHTFVFKTDLNAVEAMVKIRISGGRINLNCSADSATKNRPLLDSLYSLDSGRVDGNSGLPIGSLAA